MRVIRTLSTIFVAIALLMTSACGNDTSPPASFSTPTGTGYLRKSDTLWILNLEGNYTDMGRQYGGLLKNELLILFSQMDAAIGSERPNVKGLLTALGHLMDAREKQLLEGMASETGLRPDQHEFLNASLFFMYADIGCSAFAATGSQTESGYTIAGRNFDNPRGVFSTILRGKSILVIYNPREQFTGTTTPHRDNSVAIMSQIGWLYGLTNLNSKGIYLEYNNATNSVPIEPAQIGGLIWTYMDGLHQNLYAAFDSDSLEDVDAKLSGKVAVATITQVADKNRVWHYERTPYDNTRKILAGQAKPVSGSDPKSVFYYDNPPEMDIFTNHFFYKDWGTYQQKNDPDTFNMDQDSGSRTIARLSNLQKLAVGSAGQITAEKMQDIMTTHLQNDKSGGPFIGWELGNPDVTHFTTVTDIAKNEMHIYPYVDAMLYVDAGSIKWSTVDLNKEFR